MKRFLRHLVETGSVYWLGFAACMAAGAAMGWSSHEPLQGGKLNFTVETGDAAGFWLLLSILSTGIGVRVAWKGRER